MDQQMSGENRNDKGRFQAGHDINPDTILSWMQPGEPYSTSEIAEAHNIPRRTAYKYLNKLFDQEKIRKKKPEERFCIWINPEE